MYLTDGGTGTYATHCEVAATHVRTLPANVSYEQGAAINVAYSTAYRALFQVRSCMELWQKVVALKT